MLMHASGILSENKNLNNLKGMVMVPVYLNVNNYGHGSIVT